MLQVCGTRQESSNGYCLRVYDVDKNEWKHCTDIPLNSPRAVLAPLRISRGILNTCKVLI